MVSIKSLIWNVENNEETIKKMEDVIYNNKEKIKNLCFDFILWVMKQVPEKYERKIFSFLYNGVSIEKGYNKYYAKIPTKKEIGDMKSIFNENHKNGIYKHKERDTTLRYPYNILEFNTDKNRVHPTQKPVALMEYLIKTYTNEGDTVLDCTMGSGTTGVACKNLNRNFIGIELDENYFKIAKERINE